MKIAICDDEPLFRSELKEKLVAYKQTNRMWMDIYEFEDGTSLLESELVFDIIYLDYQMPHLDGMKTARSLRERNNICSIIFVTNYPDFVFESFEVAPYRFYQKPLDDEKIKKDLDEYIRRQKQLAPIIVQTENGQTAIPSKDILYLEGAGKYCIIRTAAATVQSSKTLSGALKLLPQFCFYRIHKSYAVNLYSVASVREDSVLLSNGECARISRKESARFKKVYRQFIKTYYLQ